MRHLRDLKRCLEIEDWTTKETIRRYQKESELYERSFNLALDTFHYICKRTKRKIMDSCGKELTLLILPRIIQSLQSIRTLTMKGYYYDASVLERSYFEAVGMCAYLSLNEEEAKKWGKGGKLGVNSTGLVNWIPKLLVGNLKTDLKPAYWKLCDYVHNNAKGVLSMVSDWHPEESNLNQEKSRLTLRYAPVFDENKVEIVSALSTTVCLAMEKIFWNELTKERKDRIEGFIDQYVKEVMLA